MWKAKSTKNMIENKWLTVKKEAVDLPNTTSIDDFYSIIILDVAVIVVVTENMEFVLKCEYKHVTGEVLIEVSIGMFEPSANEGYGLKVAKRELLKETGCVSDDWMYFGDTIESFFKLTNQMHIYFMKNLCKVAEQKIDDIGELKVLVIPVEEL